MLEAERQRPREDLIKDLEALGAEKVEANVQILSSGKEISQEIGKKESNLRGME